MYKRQGQERSSASAPNVEAPDSPETTGASPFNGVASIRIPFAAVSSEMERKARTWFLRISQEMILGSPQMCIRDSLLTVGVMKRNE